MGRSPTDAPPGEPAPVADGRGADRSPEPPAAARDHAALERLGRFVADGLDGPVTVLGVVFLLTVVGESVVEPTDGLATAFAVASWALWAVFVVEFAARWLAAPDARAFIRRNWWQVIFLLTPFLRFVRVLLRLRAARLGRLASSTVRGGRTATHALAGRVGWLLSVTVAVVLGASEVVAVAEPTERYGAVLRRTALATITGEPLGGESGVAAVLEVALGLYSVVVFATLAGTVGAFLLERRDGESRRGAGGA